MTEKSMKNKSIDLKIIEMVINNLNTIDVKLDRLINKIKDNLDHLTDGFKKMKWGYERVAFVVTIIVFYERTRKGGD